MTERGIATYDLSVDYAVGEGIEKSLKPYKNYPCKIEASFFILCTRGSMQITINAKTYQIKENDLLTLPPNYFMEIHDFSSDIYIYFAAFSSGFIESINLMKSTQHLLPVIIENPIYTLSPSGTQSYKMFYESSIIAYKFLKNRENKEIINAVLMMFVQGSTELYKMKNNWELPSYTRKYAIYQDYMQLVLKFYTVHHDVTFYADQLGLSLPHFSSSIKNATGKTPLQIITSVIIADIKARLKSTDKPVKHIALSLGFDNLSFFNKYFKQHTGITPQEYRER